MQKWKGKAWFILSCEECFVYLGRQRGGGEGSLIEGTHFAHEFFVLKQERYVFCFMNVQNFSAWVRNYKIRPEAHFSTVITFK